MSKMIKGLFGTGKQPKPDPALAAAQNRSLQAAENDRARMENERAQVQRRALAARRGLQGLGYTGSDAVGTLGGVA